MLYVRNVGRGFFPLDEELQLLPGGLTPYMHECLVRLGAWVPFERAAELLGDLLGVKVSKSQSVRHTERAGAAYVALQTEEAGRIEKEAPLAPVGAEKMVMSADGAMVPLRHGEWAEVKTLAIGEVQPPVKEKDEWVVHTRHLSYFSRLVDAERFENLTLVEVQRRGIEHCRQVAMLGDGADWVQNLASYHRPDAIRILDFPHAGQRIGAVGQVLWGEGSQEAKDWTTQRLHQLKHEGPQQILAELRTLQKEYPTLEVLSENLAYLEKREAQMQYPEFQQQGWPIGSGMVESANKLVVEARLKGAGMHWERRHVDAMLGLRNIVCSDRWQEEWPKIAERLRREAQERRKQQREKRRMAKCTENQILEVPTTAIPQPEPGSDDFEVSRHAEKAPSEKPSGPRKPAPNHPWRRMPIGRNLYKPSKPANN